jgi:hypothetical protein
MNSGGASAGTGAGSAGAFRGGEGAGVRSTGGVGDGSTEGVREFVRERLRRREPRFSLAAAIDLDRVSDPGLGAARGPSVRGVSWRCRGCDCSVAVGSTPVGRAESELFGSSLARLSAKASDAMASAVAPIAAEARAPTTSRCSRWRRVGRRCARRNARPASSLLSSRAAVAPPTIAGPSAHCRVSRAATPPAWSRNTFRRWDDRAADGAVAEGSCIALSLKRPEPADWPPAAAAAGGRESGQSAAPCRVTPAVRRPRVRAA